MTETESAPPVTAFEPEQLIGFRIGVTSDGRSGEVTAALERRAPRCCMYRHCGCAVGDHGVRHARLVRGRGCGRSRRGIGGRSRRIPHLGPRPKCPRCFAEGGTGRVVAVQLHGFVDDEQLARLQAAGATVLTVAPAVEALQGAG